MIAALALLAQTAVLPESSARDNLIVVMGRNLDATLIKWNATPEGRGWKMAYCDVVRTGGDAAVDAIACPAIETCLPKLGSPGKRVPKVFQACLLEVRRASLSALADRRADELAARDGE